MNQESRLESGANLARDLRRIRESRNISIDELNIQTKIPRTLLASFEERVLFDHDQFNRVYLRSFVRTYAATIGVSADIAVESLEAAAEGRYDGRLAREYLGEEVDYLPAAAESTTDDQGAAHAVSEENDPPVEPTPVAIEDETDESDWAATSPPCRKPTPPKRRVSRSPSHSSRRSNAGSWVGIVFGAIVVGGLVWGLITVCGGGGAYTADGDTVAGVDAPVVGGIVWGLITGVGGGGDFTSAGDTVAVVDTPEVDIAEPEAPRPRVTLDESMVFYVVAESGPVDPIRVTVDDDLRRPYWIEEGDSMRFVANERIVFEERLDLIRLNLQGYNYPASARDDQGRIVVTREIAQQFFDDL